VDEDDGGGRRAWRGRKIKVARREKEKEKERERKREREGVSSSPSVRNSPRVFPFFVPLLRLVCFSGGSVGYKVSPIFDGRPTEGVEVAFLFSWPRLQSVDRISSPAALYPNCAPSGRHKLYASSTPSFAVTKPLLMRSAHGGALIELACEREKRPDED